MDYKNGKIYRVVCSETGKQYIGSTCSSLVKRMYHHKHKANTCTSRHLINPKIILIEDYPCDRKEQLIARERYFIETMECVNYIIPGRTKYEWHQDNREEHNKRKRQYYLENREEINEKRCEQITCECGCIVSRRNISTHKKSKKHNKLIKLI